MILEPITHIRSLPNFMGITEKTFIETLLESENADDFQAALRRLDVNEASTS